MIFINYVIHIIQVSIRPNYHWTYKMVHNQLAWQEGLTAEFPTSGPYLQNEWKHSLLKEFAQNAPHKIR